MSLSKYAPSSKAFDWLFIFVAGWTTVGIYLDGWAHHHLDSSLETFFTPWHGLFYSGVFATAIVLLSFMYKNHRKGYPWRHALPKEYLYSLVGIGIMFVGGAGDMCWHLIFGIEDGMDALFSPTHLILAIGGAIALSGPLSAVWYRHKSHVIHAGPTIFSTAFFMSIITFMLQFMHPMGFPWPAQSYLDLNPIAHDFGIMLGMGCILVFTVILVGIILSTVRHWIYPFGSFALVLGINTALMNFMIGDYYEFILTSVLAGVAIDILYWGLIAKNRHRMSHIHLFSFLAPFVFTLFYMLTILATDTLTWTVHVWTGAPVIAGIAGYLISYLVLPVERGEDIL